MTDEERRKLTPARVVRGFAGLATILLLWITVIRALSSDDTTLPTVVVASGGGKVLQVGDDGASTGDTAGAAEIADLLSGGDRVYAKSANALNRSLGEPIVLRKGNTDFRVTPSRLTTGTAACAPGTLVTIDLRVETTGGADRLPLTTFVLLGSDGSEAIANPACSTGFTDGAEQRTLVFAVEHPDRLMVGTDQTAPVALWQLG
ncbi:hypothetical protein [Actinoplanes regularis]|uniref:hypothetical protein n=1 Tax=Actinoplanes regularis TaxID=52697 RepID=UPI0024A23F93|nr:hypothetical protein [Actinoplanes regularis]GLW29188.1 hypothetical protein Areg01_21280 [Actinoplanes regularis]